MGRRREHGAETAERLVDVGARLLSEQGAEAITVRRLAAEVGTSTRAVYSLFGSKEGLLSAMYRRAAQTFARLQDAVQPSPHDPVSEIASLALAYRRGALEQPDLYGLLFERAVPGFRPSNEDCRLARRSLDRVFDTVRRSIEEGFLPDSDPLDLTNQLWALVHGLASLELQGHLGPPELAEATWRRAVEAFVAGLQRSLRPVGGRRHRDRRPLPLSARQSQGGPSP